ncbi:potassium transporter [Rhodosalinus halophilus]|uniref:Potassium transporter n=1 Tax=Rhodosalinus halophilus TaxID=2259333 RepID=A0A365U699_9RHOB|nr:monovalent cation:proton antiporter-2 (CPA2) family protein [Rhodosalinus halophilus]RBI83856.1 potassium transporter [Rhodosalinus halophilus]
MEHFLLQASIYLAAAVIAVPIAARLGFGSVLGYLAAGIAIGPVLGLVGADTEELQHFAEFGVVMMLFLIGLELEPRALWNMRHKLVGLGGLQIGVTMALVTAAAMAMGFAWQTGLALGMIFALSSTAIVLQTLSEKGLIQTGGGRSAFSVLLTQDIAVIPMLALLPLLAVQAAAGHDAAPHAEGAHGGSMSLVEGLPGWGATLVTLGAVAAIILTGIYATRPVFRFIHAARLREMYTALALLIVVGIAFLMNLVGLSPALGAFLAGVVLATSEFRHELESDIEPFKGLLLGLFFITVGAGINFDVLFGAPVLILGLTLGLIALKGAVLFVLGKLFGLKGRDQWLFTLGLAQAGEFGFVLTSFSVQTNVVSAELSQTILLVVALSMLVTPLLFLLYDALAKRIGTTAEAPPADEIDETGPVIIAGIGRFGQIVNRLVQSTGYRTIVLDHNMQTIQLMRRFGFKGFFGDPTRPELLHAAGLKDARVLVVALDDPDAAVRLVAYARRERPDLHIIARARDRTHVYRLFRAGANDIVREMFDSSLRAGRYVLENIGLTDFESAEAERAFKQHDRKAVRELAQLWDPERPIAENEAYLARARELERDLETQLTEILEGTRQDVA